MAGIHVPQYMKLKEESPIAMTVQTTNISKQDALPSAARPSASLVNIQRSKEATAVAHVIASPMKTMARKSSAIF